ncbi:VOC family protein [uncultured Shimia sp.]|uniref:VOC family protein n=1 Tax=uncultured Shimia sp. TaxID=573152 RepID=UPI00262D623C|nr:VOC family protein [uncultured Shimia sp.]
MRLSGLHLRVSNPKALAEFYVSHMGMQLQTNGDALRLGYPGQDADLVLWDGGEAYEHQSSDIYWKIGITLPNVDVAYTQLRAAGVDVSEPKQFLDIGYMCHLADPEGFVIELLQQDFEGNRPDGVGDAGLPLGGGARIGQITLRSGDIAADVTPYLDLGMRCLSIQTIPDRFDLHFLAFTVEATPHPDLYYVGNREWLWKRPYTTLEFQHVAGGRFATTRALAGLEIEGLENPARDCLGTALIPA